MSPLCLRVGEACRMREPHERLHVHRNRQVVCSPEGLLYQAS
jgi:hypothetical protein